MGNLIGKSCHGNCLLWKNGSKWIILKSFNLARGVGCWEREKEVAYWCIPYHILASSLPFLSTLFSSILHFLSYSYIPYLLLYFSFLLFSSLVFPYSLLASHYSCCFSLYTAKAFYTACREEFYYFIPHLLLTCCLCPSQMVLVCQVLSHHHYPVLATNTFHSHIKEFCFVFLLSVASPTG